MWEDATNSMIDSYHNIVKNKDLTGREKALATNKLMRYVPLVKNARNILSQRMQEWNQAVASDSVSSAFPPKFQQIYTDLKKGDFDGGIVVDGDNMYFRGVTSQGEEINLPLQDFELNLPGIMQKGISYTDSVDGQVEVWDQELAKFKQTGKESDRPVYNKEAIIDAMEEGIAKNGEKGDMIFAMDTMGLTHEAWDNLWQSYYNIEDTDSIMTSTTLEGLAAMKDDNGNPKYTPEQLERLKGKSIITTEVQAKQLAVEELLEQYADGMKVIYNKSKQHYSTATPYSDPTADKNNFSTRAAVATSDLMDVIAGQTPQGQEIVMDDMAIMQGMPENFVNGQLTFDGKLKFNDINKRTFNEEEGKYKPLEGYEQELDLTNPNHFEYYWKKIQGEDLLKKKNFKMYLELQDLWNKQGDDIYQSAQEAIRKRKIAYANKMRAPWNKTSYEVTLPTD